MFYLYNATASRHTQRMEFPLYMARLHPFNRLARGSDPRLITILLIVFVQILGASMALPILPIYGKNSFDLEPNVVTLLISAFFAAQFLAGPFIGRLSDIYGRLPVLIISQIGTVFSFLLLAGAQSAWVLLFARILDGVTGGNIIVAQAYVTDISSREKRTQTLGLIFAAFGVGFIFGPSLAGVLSALFGPRMPFLIAAVLAFATLLLTYFTLDETLTPEQREANRNPENKVSLKPRQVLQNGPLMLVLLVAFIGQFGLGLLIAAFALYGEAELFADFSPEATDLGIGLLLGTVGYGQIFTQLWLLKRALVRLNEARLAIIGAVLRAFGMLWIIIIPTPFIGPIGMITFAIGSGLMMPSLQSLSTETVPDELRGGVLGLYQSALSLSTIFSTALGGTLFALSPDAPFLVGAGLLILVSVPGLFLVRRSDQGSLMPEGLVVAGD